MRTATKPSNLVNVLMISLGLSLVHPLSAVAGTITFNDLGDTVSVTLSPDLIARGALTSCRGEVCGVVIPGPVGAGTPTGPASPLNILEPGSSIISDILTSTFNASTGNFALIFNSDTNEIAGLGPFTTGSSIVENGTVQPGGTIDWHTAAAPTIDTIQFQSDVTRVPEPISLVLFGAGLIGIGAMRRRRKAKP